MTLKDNWETGDIYTAAAANEVAAQVNADADTLSTFTETGLAVATAVDAATAQTALGATTIGSDVFTAADADEARAILGATIIGSGMFTAADAAAARTILGATTIGSDVFTAADAVAARSDLGVEATSVDTFNVKDYGAVGDLSTDDTVAIQAAIDAAEARTLNSSPVANARVVVYFPAGRYVVNGGLTVTRNDIHFVGPAPGASRIFRTVKSETPVITVTAQNFSIRQMMIRCDLNSYGGDSDGNRTVAIDLSNPVGELWDNSIDANVESCIIAGFYAAIKIFGQGLTVVDCGITRVYHGAILDFPDTEDIIDNNDDNQDYAETGFRVFRFEGIRVHATVGAFIKNIGNNAAYLRSCILSNITADVGAELWDGVMSNTIVTNWQVEMSGLANPTVFNLADGSHDSMIINGRVLGRKASGDISEKAPDKVLYCDGDVSNLHLRNLYFENVQQNGLVFTGSANGIYISDCHFKSVGYSGSGTHRQILFYEDDVQVYLSNVTFDLDPVTSLSPIGGIPGDSSTIIIGDNVWQVDEDHSDTDVVPGITGTVVINRRANKTPDAGHWNRGEIIWNKADSAVPLGWRCSVTGAPGTWEPIYKAPDTVWIPAASGYADTGATPVTPTKLASGEVPAIFMPGAGDTYLRAPVSIPEDWDTMWIDVFYTHEEASPSGSVRFNVGVVHLDLNAQIGSAITSQRQDTVDMSGVVANDFTIHTAGAAVDVDTTGGPVMVRAGRIGGSVSDTFTGDIAVIGVQLRKAT